MNTKFKNYQISKISKYVANENIFLISQSVNKNSNDKTKADQSMNKIKFQYFKIANKIACLALNQSIFKNTSMVYKSSVVFLNPKIKKMQNKKNLIKVFDKIMINLLLVKLNNKIYSIKNFKISTTLSYKESIITYFINKLRINKKIKMKFN